MRSLQLGTTGYKWWVNIVGHSVRIRTHSQNSPIHKLPVLSSPLLLELLYIHTPNRVPIRLVHGKESMAEGFPSSCGIWIAESMYVVQYATVSTRHLVPHALKFSRNLMFAGFACRSTAVSKYFVCEYLNVTVNGHWHSSSQLMNFTGIWTNAATGRAYRHIRSCVVHGRPFQCLSSLQQRTDLLCCFFRGRNQAFL